MDAMLNPQNENPSASFNSNGNSNEKSDLMKFFEYQVNDAYWAYKDLLKEIFENDNESES